MVCYCKEIQIIYLGCVLECLFTCACTIRITGVCMQLSKVNIILLIFSCCKSQCLNSTVFITFLHCLYYHCAWKFGQTDRSFIFLPVVCICCFFFFICIRFFRLCSLLCVFCFFFDKSIKNLCILCLTCQFYFATCCYCATIWCCFYGCDLSLCILVVHYNTVLDTILGCIYTYSTWKLTDNRFAVFIVFFVFRITIECIMNGCILGTCLHGDLCTNTGFSSFRIYCYITTEII